MKKATLPPVYFEDNTFKKLNSFLKKNQFSQLLVLADSNTLKYCYPLLAQACSSIQKAEIIEIESGEQYKTLETCAAVWEGMSEQKTDRNALMINLGGGVISDLGGFIASIYKRGISFIHIPTSLLAMADASVGGKCGVDLNNIKNILGTIQQPEAVFINPTFLHTLEQHHLRNGMAEIIKMGIIADAKLIKDLQEKKKDIIEVIKKSVALKNAIVAKDPFDKAIRKTLNFGHTVGHAIESLYLGTANELLHGEAIAIGMIIESIIAFQKKMISKTELNIITELLAPHYPMPSFSKKELETLSIFMLNDKKNKGQKIKMSLVSGLGKCKFDVDVSRTDIEKAIHHYHLTIATKQ